MAPRRVGVAGALWSKRQLSIEFGVTESTVAKRLDRVPPDGLVKGHDAWFVASAAPAILLAGSDGDRAGGQDARTSIDDLSPKDRKDWVSSEHELMRMRAYAKELVPVGEVREMFATVVKAFSAAWDTFADQLEREVGITPEQVEATQRLSDRTRSSLLAMFSADAGDDD